MVKSRTKLIDRVLAVTLAVIMVLAMLPASTFTAYALSYEAGSECSAENCEGKLQWVANPEIEGQHHLVCDNTECAHNALIEAYVIHNEGEGGDDCLLCNPPHAHGDFVYSLENEGKTLVATCGSTGTCDLDGKKVSITIAAPAELEYNGTVKAATIIGADEWKTITGNDAPEITYSAEPKAVGTYTASITVSETTAAVEFTIIKGTPTYNVPANLTAKYGQTLADVVLTAGFTWEDPTISVGEIGENTFEATFTPSDTTNYNIVENIEIKVVVGKATSIIAAPSISGESTHTSITLETITPTEGNGTVEYGYVEKEEDKDDPSKVTNWQEDTTFTGLEGSKTYYFYARISETENYTAAVSPMATISTKDKLNGEVTIDISDWTYGETAVDPDYEIVVGDYGAAKVEYANKGQTNWTETVPTKAGEYTVRVVYNATAVYAEAIKTCDFEIKQKEVTIEWTNTSLTYNSQAQKPTATITAGIVGTDDVAVVVSGEKQTVGVDYTAEATLSGEAKDNYVIKANKTQLFTIGTKEVIITWSNTSLNHNRNQQKPTATINDGEIFTGDDISVEVSGAKKRPGTYTATATLTGEDALNYHIKNTPEQESLVTCQFVISNIPTPAQPYTIENESGNEVTPNANGWYNYNVVIKPAAGYTIGIADDDDGDFKSELLITESKTNYTVFLKDGRGDYTGAVVVGNINIDKSLPNASIKLGESTPWDIFLETITFGIYHKNEVTVTLSGSDDNSGIDHVYYHKVEKNRLTNQDLFDKDTIQGSDVVWTEGSTVTVNADNDYVVYAKVVDKAGNPTYVSTQGFVYDATKPEIKVTFNNNSAANAKYFKENRTATIEITEHNFNGAALTVTENGTNTSANYSLNWTSVGDVHTATVLFENEADYTFAISCVDKAGNPNNPVVYVPGSEATNEFTIDKSRPNVSLVIEGLVKDAEQPWSEPWSTEDGDGLDDKVLSSIDFNNRWSNSNAKVSATSTDNLSGVDYIEYFTTENIVTNITEVPATTWTNSTSGLTTGRDAFQFEVAPNAKFIVYVHVVDKAGNDIYLSSNGVIVDNKAPGGDNYSPEIDITLPTANANGIYNEDDTVKVDFKVVEPKYSGVDGTGDAGSFSGIKEITYVIKADDIEKEQPGTFELTPDNTEADSNGLISSWTGSIEINKDEFNSNNVVVLITAVDNAGNTHTSTTKVGDIKIDVTAPTIAVSYDDVSKADSGKYFKAGRVATIVVTERNFNAKDFSFVFMKDGAPVEVKGESLNWTETKATSGNGDVTTNTASYTFDADADYLLGSTGEVKTSDGKVTAPYFLYSDLADNSFYYVDSNGQYTQVSFTGEATTDFTIDTKAPEVSVSYNNNSAENEKYFKDFRTVTIKIVEHNFPINDIERVVFSQTAERGGEVPKVTWSHDGDTHIATFNYNKDGDYTFDVTMKDLAGNESAPANYGSSVAGKDFIIDTTYEDMISQSGVENGVAYGHDAEVIPNIKISDINLQEYTVTLTGVQKDKTIDLTNDVNALLNKGAETVTGILDIFETKQDLDGIYTLKMTSKDKAGNEDSMEIVFTINRFGSVYVFEDYLLNLVTEGGAFVQKIDSDLVITEFNADKLVADSLKIEITVDGKPLENVQYTVTPEINDTVSVGSSGWYQYKYTISKDNFAADGVYKISISSEDATGNTPENSNYEDKGMTFRVDSTKAEISSVVGLEEAIINAQEVTVKYTIFDTIGIKSIMVYVDGKPVNEITDFTADPNNYSGSFTLAESSSAQAVRIVVEDMAGNITDTNAEDFAPAYEFNGSVTVSTNIFVRWYANKPLFWGSIGGVVVVAGALWFFLAGKKKKKEEATAK